MVKLSEQNQKTFDQLYSLWQSNRLAPGILLHGPNHGAAIIGCQELLTKVHGKVFSFESINPDVFVAGHLMQEEGGQSLSVDIIRQARSFAYKSSVTGGPRFLIIDHAESMTHQAQNALLKILETPPANVFFVLIASHLHGVIATIRSRCQFYAIADHDYETFVEAAKEVGLTTDENTLKWLCALTHGDPVAAKQATDFDFSGFETGIDQLICSEDARLLLKMVPSLSGQKNKPLFDLFMNGLLLTLSEIKNQLLNKQCSLSVENFSKWAEATSLDKIAYTYQDLLALMRQHNQLGLDARQTLVNAIQIFGKITGDPL
tara:strand:- start:18644 stop:19597 length:954 start_codon:yes stop_codon:yes gene_type:complete